MSESTAKRLPQNILPVISGANREELAVALYLCVKEAYSVAEAVKDLKITEDAFHSAVAFWRGAGVCFAAEEKAEVPPEERDVLYDTVTVARSLEHDEGFKAACQALQSIYGKMFTRFDYDSLLYLYDHCGLTADYLCLLANYCVEKGKKALKYFTKAAQGLVSDGVDTYEKLEKHLEKRARATDRVYKLRKLCGMGDRAFTAREDEYVNDWFAEKDLSFELVKHAYDTTVNAIGEVKLSYMNKILARWHKDGLLTVDAVKQAEQQPKAQPAQKSGTSFDDDAFFAAAVARTKKKREQK